MSEMNKLFNKLLSENIIQIDTECYLHKISDDYKIYYNDEYEVKYFELYDDNINMFDENGLQLFNNDLDGNIALDSVSNISIYHKILII